jgi:hypothetical protein
MREPWCQVTVYDSMGRPGILKDVHDTSEVALDTAAGGWWVRDRVRCGFLLLFHDWSEPYLITPGCDLDPFRETHHKMMAQIEAMKVQSASRTSDEH